MKIRFHHRTVVSLTACALGVVLALGTGHAQEKPATEPSQGKEFFFDHQYDPERFIKELQKHFGLDWQKVVTIPLGEFGPIPKFRIETGDPMDVIKLYNRLADHNPGMGRWVVEGSITNPSAVILVPDPSVGDRTIKVRAFPLQGIPRDKWESLEDLARDTGLRMMYRRGDSAPQPGVRIAEDAEVLVAFGSDEFVQFVDSLLEAYRVNLMMNADTTASTNQPARK